MWGPDTAKARERRYRRICSLVCLQPCHRVLDLGCGRGASFEVFNLENETVGLDRQLGTPIEQSNFTYVAADGIAVPFKDKQFDAVICIGVLEHVFPREAVGRIAGEIRRLGRRYAVVVPDRSTLIEPHYRLPLWQFYPGRLRSLLTAAFPLGPYRRGELRPLNYLSRHEWLSFFPDAEAVTHNHISFLVRDLILYRRA